LEEVFLESAVSGFLEVLVLDVLQEGSLLGGTDVLGASLKGFSLGLDAVNDAVSSGTDFIQQAGVAGAWLASGELIIRAGFKSFTTESRVVQEDSLEVLEAVLAGAAVDAKSESRSVGARKSEAFARASDVESSEEGISPIVELEDESIVVLEVEDAERSDGTKDWAVTSGFLDFGFFEEEGFDTLD